MASRSEGLPSVLEGLAEEISTEVFEAFTNAGIAGVDGLEDRCKTFVEKTLQKYAKVILSNDNSTEESE